jgi:hypothetical protein
VKSTKRAQTSSSSFFSFFGAFRGFNLPPARPVQTTAVAHEPSVRSSLGQISTHNAPDMSVGVFGSTKRVTWDQDVHAVETVSATRS